MIFFTIGTDNLILTFNLKRVILTSKIMVFLKIVTLIGFAHVLVGIAKGDVVGPGENCLYFIL